MPRTFSTGIEVPSAGDRHPSEQWWSRTGATTNAAIERMDSANRAAWKAALDALRKDSVPRSEAAQYGIPGPANTLRVGSVAGGTTAAANITGTAPAQTLNLTLPQGPRGPIGPGGAFPLTETADAGIYEVGTVPIASYATIDSSKADAQSAEAAAVAKAKAYTDVAFASSGPGGATDEQVDAAVSRAVQGRRVLGRQELTILATDYGMSMASSDNTAAIQAAVDAAAQTVGEVLLPAGSYTVTGSVTIPSGVRVVGQGVKLVQTSNTPTFLLAEGARDVTITGVTFQGTMPESLVATIQNQIGIRGMSTPTNPIRDLTVTHCRFIGMQGSGIQVKNLWDFRFQNNDMTHYGSSGIGCYSVRRGVIEGNVLRATGKLPAYSGNAYGIFVSTLEADGPVGSAEAPRSTDVMVRNNLVVDQVWSALDTHVGKRISFIGNHLVNCKASGINAVYIATSGVNFPLSPQDIVIADNVITYDNLNETDTLLQQAILLRGSIDHGNQNRERATGLIRGNLIRGAGFMNSSNSAAIFMGSSAGVIVDSNTLRECRSMGVQIRDSIGTTVSNNTFVDMWRVDNPAIALFLRVSEDINMDVTVIGNKFVRGALKPGIDVPASARINTSGIHGSADIRVSTVESSNEWGNAAHISTQRRMQKGIKGQTTIEGTAAPTGSKPDGNPWLVGDKTENILPSPGSPMGWVCVSGGSPGSWRPFGRIDP